MPSLYVACVQQARRTLALTSDAVNQGSHDSNMAPNRRDLVYLAQPTRVVSILQGAVRRDSENYCLLRRQRHRIPPIDGQRLEFREALPQFCGSKLESTASDRKVRADKRMSFNLEIEAK